MITPEQSAKPLLVVSTCGTSLLTNGAAGELGGLLRRTANHREVELTPEERDLIRQRAQDRAEALDRATLEEARSLSAELNGLMGIYEGQVMSEARGRNHHIFLHTDTFQGQEVARLLLRWTEARGLVGETHQVDKLNTARMEDFREGMGNLTDWCADTLPGYRDGGYRVVFNLIGGFKALQGFMQTLGMFYADESVYLFEGERALLRIPRLPVDLDEGARTLMSNHLNLFRRLDRTTVPVGECGSIPETLLFQMDGECELSPWGKMLWQRFRTSAYEERVWPAPTPRIRYTPAFQRAAEGLSEKKYRRYINERMDDLARFLEQGVNLSRLDFKGLKGTRFLPATHEIDAWADRGAWRILGRYDPQDNNVFILENLIEHVKE